ncbi:MAG: Fe-S cluster assembly protein SufD [Lysobacterales bacterium]|jgi:Fe-S cluster assembly protein SufD
MNHAVEQAVVPGWLDALRENAAGQFRAGGLPHRKVEAWKYTPMRLLEGIELTPGPMESTDPAAGRVAPAPLCERGLLVDICDGQLCSAPQAESGGLTVLSLDQGIQRFEERLRPLFESVSVDGPTRAFAALNTAYARQGLVLHVAAGADAGRLLLRWYFRDAAARELRHFRVFLLLDDGARLDLVEQYQSVSGAPGALNVMLQADLAAGASLRHTRLQAEPEDAMLLTSTALEQAGDSRYEYRGFDLGSSLARHELTVRLRGDGATADLAGAFVLDGKRHVDNHVCVEHLAPGCSSEQFFRGVLGGRSRGVFNGRALIQPGADGSSVRQSNANLLLSPLAEMDTKPELEIYADEVEASHGATVGQLDDKAVFYLRSRGLNEREARHLLTVGFCRAVTDKVEGRGLAQRIGELLDAAMPIESP